MFSTLITATLLSAAFAVQGVLAELVINTIALNQCDSAHVTWSGGEAPYNLAVVPVDDPCNTVLVDLGDHNGTSMTWYNVTIPAGTDVIFSLLDSSDEEAWSADITVGGGSSACLSNSTNSSASASASSSLSEPATTLVLTSSFPATAATATPSESATIVGAANAGTLGNASGAMSSIHLPVVSTVLASLAAVVAALAL